MIKSNNAYKSIGEVAEILQLKSKRGNSYIVFDYKGKGFLMITRVSNNSKITI